ncbi:Uncharacterized lipoprotein YmbA [Desulfuromusa kysingii]|uniref:Uncharacterized lipoprotein YmbA n=1 Tax=Desulfuromusa kysingii TaxID=37625 RepID=A0A1H3YST2_9BACT|nr:ABC-type transport auxiliary lipoprotein family protein [Desulfuromusa kysingii]SEA14619.1 Uncharacterized lipoprotein YmbA [Desulfuromusa kysingii]
MRYLIFTLLFLCSACIQIGSAPQPTNYYLLEPMRDAQEIRLDSNLNIHLELISFPEYLDRYQIVTKGGKNGIVFSDSERWAEPVRDNLMRVIREDLMLLIPNSTITLGPWESSSSSASAIKVKLIVNQFSGELGAYALTDIRWKIRREMEPMSQGHFTDRQDVGENFSDFIVTLNREINNFSSELAMKLREH